MSKSLVLATIIVLTWIPVSASLINVPDEMASIQEAIDSSSHGDTVLVAPGTYYEYLSFRGKNLTLASHFLTTGDRSFIDSTVFDGQYAGKLVVFDSGEDSSAVLTGFTIKRGWALYGHGAGIFCTGSSPTIRSNIIRDNLAFYMGGGIFVGNSSPLIEDNIIIGNNVPQGSGGGIYCDYGSHPRIINNDICLNEARDNGGGVYFNEAVPVFASNTIADNVADSCGGGVFFRFSEPDVTNSVIRDNLAGTGSQVHVFGDLTPTFSYCNISGGWSGSGNIDLDPFFVAAADTNYQLCAQSPCIDAGDPGLVDPDGSRSDIGRYTPDHPYCAIGKIIYVSESGSDSTGDGTQGSPWRTVQRGIDMAFDSDTVLIEEGTYDEDVSFQGKKLRVGSRYLLNENSAHIAATTIRGSGTRAVVTFNHDEDSASVLMGLTISNGFEETWAEGGGVGCFESSPVIMNNVITDNDGSGVACTGTLYVRPKPLVIGNTISGNRAFMDGGGVYVQYSNPTIIDNVIESNEARYGGGIFLIGAGARVIGNLISGNRAGSKGGGVCDVGYRSALSTNRIVGNVSDSLGGGLYILGSPLIVTNCTFWGNIAIAGGGIYVSNQPTPVITNNIVWNNSATDSASIYNKSFATPVVTYSDIEGGYEGEGNIDSDPMLCNPGALNFELASLSPCVGAGLDSVDIGALGVGCSATDVADSSPGGLPDSPDLKQNRPNPFNPSTVIDYSLSEKGAVRITVHNLLGQMVSVLVDREQSAGSHQVRWNGTDRDGQKVATGVYLYRLETGDFVRVRKMVLIR